MIFTDLINYLETHQTAEGWLHAHFGQIPPLWQKHVYGKQWTAMTGFGSPNQTATLEDGWLLYSLVRACKPKICLEIGTANGFTGIMIGAALAQNHGGLLYTVDRDGGAIDRARENLFYFGLQHVVVAECGDALKVLPTCCKTLTDGDNKIDFFFEDGNHGSTAIVDEMRIIQPYLAKGCYLAFHDTLFDPNVMQGIDEMLELFPPNVFEGITYTTSRGLTVLHHKLSMPLLFEEKHNV